MREIINRKFYLILGLIFLAELLSIFSFLLPEFRVIVFFTILIITLLISIHRLEYGLYILITELIIGSKGYLFYIDYDGLLLSIRIALWLIIMSIWVGRIITQKFQGLKELKKFQFLNYFIVLFLFILWGLINGKLNNNAFNNIFFDFNGWLYFALIFPFYSVFQHKNTHKNLFQIFNVAIVWLCLKTIVLLYFFSHDILGVNEFIYTWVRNTGVGEITRTPSGFYRIFFQSHIFILIGFFVYLSFLLNLLYKKNLKLDRYFFLIFSGITLTLAINIISFSRSNWVGLLAGCFLLLLFILNPKEIKRISFIKLLGLSILSIIISFGIIFVIVKFPFPQSTGSFNPELVTERAKQVSGEAGVSSRWSLLPKLWKEIGRNPIMGQGFGTTVTYISNDPRVLSSNPSGEYTTYAFEWGWLDIWLKLGLFGLTAYLSLLLLFFFQGLKNSKLSNLNDSVQIALITGLLSIIVVSFFSPYLNHPLGIGYILILSVILKKN